MLVDMRFNFFFTLKMVAEVRAALQFTEISSQVSLREKLLKMFAFLWQEFTGIWSHFVGGDIFHPTDSYFSRPSIGLASLTLVTLVILVILVILVSLVNLAWCWCWLGDPQILIIRGMHPLGINGSGISGSSQGEDSPWVILICTSISRTGPGENDSQWVIVSLLKVFF